MKRRKVIGALLGLLLLWSTAVRADVLFGECSCEGARISTSWNSRTGYCRDGKYRIAFDGRVKSNITVYVRGENYGRVYVDRATRFDIDCRK